MGAIRDNRILVLVHSTKRESASLPLTGATKGASQKWYHAYKKDKRVTVRWWKTVNDPLHGQALMEIQKELCCRFCVVGDVAPEHISQPLSLKEKIYITVDIRRRNTADQFDRF